MAQRCGSGRGLLVHGEEGGVGVLVWVRGGESAVLDTGTYPLLSRGDTMAARGAIAAVRFLLREVGHGLTIDDGSATLTRATAPLTLLVRGLGVEITLAQQYRAELAFGKVPLLADTAVCRAEP